MSKKFYAYMKIWNVELKEHFYAEFIKKKKEIPWISTKNLVLMKMHVICFEMFNILFSQ